MLEQISDKYEIYVITLNLFNQSLKELPSSHNGIHITYARLPAKEFSLKYFLLKIKSKTAIRTYKAKYKTTYYYDKLYILSKQIERLVVNTGAKTLISVSTPTDIHICTEMALKGSGYPEWIPVCFDPHAYNSAYSPELREAFKKEEEILYANAKRIFMVSQSKRDYAQSPLNAKITYFELPTENIDLLAGSEPDNRATDENKPIKITYIGNLYNSIRKPDYMLSLLGDANDLNFTLNIVGAFIGYGDSLSEYQQSWTERFNGKLKITGRLPREEAQEYISTSDFLINLGNTAENQCPSKVTEYISTGKPVIHFKKTDNCSSMPYLSKYPNACIIDERDPSESNLLKLKQFILNNRGKTVDKNVLKELYKENDIKYISDLLASQIEAG